MATITPDLMTAAGKFLFAITTPTAASASTDVVNFWVYPLGPQILAVANTASYTTNTKTTPKPVNAFRRCPRKKFGIT